MTSIIKEALDKYGKVNKQKVKNRLILAVKVRSRMKELGMTREELSQKNSMTMDQVDDLLFGDLNLTIDDITVLEQILDIKLLSLSMGT